MKFLPALLFFVTAASAGDLPAVKPLRGEIHRWVTLPSNLVPRQQVDLRARVAGYVKSISVDKGDVVKAGQQLAEIEVPELQADLISHRAETAAAEVDVKRLHEARQKSPDLDLPQSVDDAEARLAIAKARLDRALTLLDFAQIKAPFPGVITTRLSDPGAYAAAGGTPLLHLVDASTLRLQIPVMEAESALVRIGQTVEARIDAISGESVKGSVSRTSFALDEATRTLLVEADIPNEDGKIRPGMFATARIALEKHENTLLIPVGALFKEKTNSFVFKYLDGKAVKTAVKPVFNDGTHVEIPELAPDDIILLPGVVVLTDGQEVSVKAP